MATYSEEKIRSLGLVKEALPKHVAIIMDGNNRWAKKRLLPGVAGHKAGVDAVRAVIEVCAEAGV